MRRFVCPECGDEADYTPRYGDEIISVHCLKHAFGPDGHSHPVLMIEIPVTVPATEREPVSV